jgi:hypothetical protein
MRDLRIAQTRVCDALRTRQGASSLVQAAQCLEGSALRADAVVRVLSRPLPEGVAALDRALDRWEDPLSCVTPAAVRPPAPPSSEERALRQAVEEVVLASLLGRHEQAIAGAQRLLPEARERESFAELAELETAWPPRCSTATGRARRPTSSCARPSATPTPRAGTG